MFLWAYGRSVEQYVAARQSLGEPDPFRFKHSAAFRQVVGDVVREHLDRKAGAAFLARWMEENIASVRPGQFAAWQEVWSDRTER